MRFRAASALAAVAAFVALALVVGSGPALEGQAGRGKAALLKPAELKEQAPDTYKVNFDTSAGPFVVEVHRNWAPSGADRFYNLVKRGFYDESRFHWVIAGYVAQFGVSADPEITKAWIGAAGRIPDDPWEVEPNRKGTVAFADAGLNRRSTQVLIHLGDNSEAYADTHAPFGQVISGMNVVEKLYSGYKDGPDRNRHFMEGNAYLSKELPKLDYIKTATIAQ